MQLSRFHTTDNIASHTDNPATVKGVWQYMDSKLLISVRLISADDVLINVETLALLVERIWEVTTEHRVYLPKSSGFVHLCAVTFPRGWR